MADLATAVGAFARVGLEPADRAAIARIIERSTAVARRAWDARNAGLMIPDTSAVSLRTPQGQVLTAADLRRDLQRRMDMTVRVDTMTEALDSVQVVRPDSVLAYSKQRFVRVVRLADGTERQRISTVTHERSCVRRKGQWAQAGPLREIDPRAWWAGETPPPPPAAPDSGKPAPPQ